MKIIGGIVSPDQVANLYPFPMTAATYNLSEVDSSAPDLAAFPGYADVTAVEATLETGDMLFLPAFWYHDFVHLGEFNLTLNFWFDAPAVPMSAVVLRNEVATIRAQAGRREDPVWQRFGEALDQHCLSWSPGRATVDELGPDGAPRPVTPLPDWVRDSPAGARG